MPGLTGVGGDPGFFGGAGKLPVQSVGEFDSNRFEARSFVPEDDDESDYGRGAMGRGDCT